MNEGKREKWGTRRGEEDKLEEKKEGRGRCLNLTRYYYQSILNLNESSSHWNDHSSSVDEQLRLTSLHDVSPREHLDVPTEENVRVPTQDEEFQGFEELLFRLHGDGAELRPEIELMANRPLVKLEERIGRSDQNPTVTIGLGRRDREGGRIGFEAEENWRKRRRIWLFRQH